MCDVIGVWEFSKLSKQPEERVRQDLLTKMIEELGYPEGLLVVERRLDALPHIDSSQPVPSRRFDVVCLAKGLHRFHALYPLLLIECKVRPIHKAAVRQVIGYNRFVRAVFIGIADQHEVYLGRCDPVSQEYLFSPTLPSFSSLVEEAKCRLF